MEVIAINSDNYERTVVQTIDSQEVRLKSYYLDYHIYKGNKYYTVSQDEAILNCYDNESEAKDYFYKLIGEE